MRLKTIRKFKVGLKQIIIEVVTGLLTTLALNWLAHMGWLPDKAALVINILLIIMNILLAKSMLSWGIFYTLGWLIGTYIFYQLGLLGTWDFILYFVLPIVILIFRVAITLKKSFAI